MQRRATMFLAATAIVAASAPARAQDHYVLPPPPPVESYPQADYAMPVPVQAPLPPHPGEVHPMPGYAAHGYATHAYATPAPYPAAPPRHAYHAASGLPPVASVGYTRDERDQWLRECRQAYEGARKQGTGIVGGILGAIGGGLLGHEITDGSRTRRIGGTLIGAGVGGLVGLALGAAIGGAFDKKKMDECEGYLERYQGGGYLPGPEAGFGYGWQQRLAPAYGYGGYATVMVPVQVGGGYTYSAPIRTESRYVVEDVVEEVVHAPRRTKYVKRAPATKYAPDKRVRYAK